MSDSDSNDKFVAIESKEGGYLVNLGSRQIIVTSLNKAIKLVRDYLNVDGSSSEGE
jgi:hypothetical protein